MIAEESDMKRSIVAILFVLAALAAAAMAADPWTGTWKIEPGQIQSPGRPLAAPEFHKYYRNRRQYVAHDGTPDRCGRQSAAHGVHGRFGWQRIPRQSIAAAPKPYTISFRQIDPRTREYILDMGGMTIKGQDVLSEDGKTFSRIIGAKDAEGNDASVIQVFEKQ